MNYLLLGWLKGRTPYVPMTLVIRSIALALICEATKYVSNSEGVLQWHMKSVEKKFENISW